MNQRFQMSCLAAVVFLVAAGCSKATPAAGSTQGDATGSSSQVAAADSRDQQFLAAWRERAPASVAAVEKLTDEIGSGRCAKRTPECTALARDALRLAREVVKLAADTDVSTRLEPLRLRTEAGFGINSAAMGSYLKYYEGGPLDSVRRASKQLTLATPLVVESAKLFKEVSSTGGASPAHAALAGPARGQVQRDLTSLIGSERGPFKYENVYVVTIGVDAYEKDVAAAEARGESFDGDEWAKWKGTLTYRKVQDFWKLDEASSCIAAYGSDSEDTWVCDHARIR